MALTLQAALAIGDRDVVVFVGAGGKTTSMYRLARELRAAGASVVATTTTKIFPPPPSDDLAVAIDPDLGRLVAEVRRGLAEGRIVVLGRELTTEGKLAGVPPEWIAELAAVAGVTHVLVEADGAARKPLTAPREYEPVIPASATIVVPIVGADALGQALSAEVAHRPERVAALTGLAAGDRLDARSIARVMLHPEGNTRGRPLGARVTPLVNKADTTERRAAAREIAAELLKLGATRVVVGAVAGVPPVVECVDDF